jgi:hypothetical protein
MAPRKTHPYTIENSVEYLFQKLPRPTIHRLSHHLHKLAPSYGLTYTDERGKTNVITITLRPRLIEAAKRDSLWQTIRILDGAFQKIAHLYFEIPSFTELFPFTPQELNWLSLLEKPGYRKGRIASRWDANTTFGRRDWQEGFSFFEVNGVGVGGIWYSHACAEMILKTVVPELQRIDPGFRPVPNHDMSRLLLGILLNQRKKLGRTRGTMALVMEKASGSNFIEFEHLAALYEKLGYPTLVAEPTDLTLKGREVFIRGRKIDILYRDTTLSELCHLEEKGHDLRAFRQAFYRGQVVSSLEGEFDHKSVFEVFTSPNYASFFTTKEKKIFKQYILWTRLLRENNTTDPQGKPIDLIPFVLKKQSQLVLKPNRLYGGKGILFGHDVTPALWERKIESCLKEQGHWVIQQLGKLRRKRFFRREGKKARERNLYVVSGFLATERGLGIVGRMSELTVVNVAQRGGLTPILLVQ